MITIIHINNRYLFIIIIITIIIIADWNFVRRIVLIIDYP